MDTPVGNNLGNLLKLFEPQFADLDIKVLTLAPERIDLWAVHGCEVLHYAQQRTVRHTWAATGEQQGSWRNQSILDKLITEVPLDCLVREGPSFLGCGKG